MTVLSTNAEILDGLVPYLRVAGMNVVGLTAVGDTQTRVTHAFVVFADDFAVEELRPLVDEVTEDPRGPSMVIVTAQPGRATVRFGLDRRSNRPVTLGRPVCGFTVLNALRHRMEPRHNDEHP